MKNITLYILFGFFVVCNAQQNKLQSVEKWNDSCFIVHGRLSVCNGNPTFRIWIIGTNHVLGIYDHGEENPEMPDTLQNIFKDDLQIRVYGDYTVVPLAKYRKGEMQLVRVISFSNLLIKNKK
jgi:hypothetical protein